MSGWIKLHRQIRDSSFYRNSTAKAVWLECLLRASHTEREIYIGREKIQLSLGQFLLGRDEIARILGEKPTTVWYWICRFESDSMVDIKKTSKGSLVTVKNWSHYQIVDSAIDIKLTTDGQQKDTNKKEENVKNEKTTYAVRPKKEERQPPAPLRAETVALAEAIDATCKHYSVRNETSSRGLDIIVERYLGKIHMKVEMQHALAWLVTNNDKTGKDRPCSTSFIGNWFKKAKEIQKREQLKQFEMKEKKDNPAMAERREKKEAQQSMEHFLSANE